MQFGMPGCSHLALLSVTGGHLGFRSAAHPTQAKRSRELFEASMNLSSAPAADSRRAEHNVISDAMLASIMGEDLYFLGLSSVFATLKPASLEVWQPSTPLTQHQLLKPYTRKISNPFVPGA